MKNHTNHARKPPSCQQGTQSSLSALLLFEVQVAKHAVTEKSNAVCSKSSIAVAAHAKARFSKTKIIQSVVAARFGSFRCLGYERTIHFVDEHAREKRSSQGMQASGLEESQPVTGNEVMTLIRSYKPNIRSTQFSPPKEIDLSAFEATMHLSFLSQKMFSGAPNTESSQSMADSWLHSSVREMDSNSTTYNAVRALGAAFFGNVLNQPDIARKGSLLYGKSLRMLNRDLKDASAVQRIETLTNAMILGLYEVGEFPIMLSGKFLFT